MMHRTKHRFAAFGISLLFLLLSGCQSGGSVLVMPDKSESVPRVEWQTLLLNEMNKQRVGSSDFLRDDDASAKQILECVQALSEGDASAAKQILTEDKGDQYAVGAHDIRIKLELSENDKTRLVSYAVVPQERAGDVALWDADTIKQLAYKLIENSCYISLNEAKPTADNVGFAMGKIGDELFIIAAFR